MSSVARATRSTRIKTYRLPGRVDKMQRVKHGYNVMTTAILENELKALPEAERTRVISEALRELSPTTIKTLERRLRRLAHPEVPEDVWTGFEEAEDGQGVEIKDEHFAHPPV